MLLPLIEAQPSAPGELDTVRDTRTSGRVTQNAQRVLLVEDDPVCTTVAKTQLRMLGYQVETADNGRAALEKFQEGKFFAVLMDMQMPVMDGLAAVRALRKLNGGEHVPVIALTANVLPSHRKACEEAGMSAFLPKPFKKAELEKVLEKFQQNSLHAAR